MKYKCSTYILKVDVIIYVRLLSSIVVVDKSRLICDDITRYMFPITYE